MLQPIPYFADWFHDDRPTLPPPPEHNLVLYMLQKQSQWRHQPHSQVLTKECTRVLSSPDYVKFIAPPDVDLPVTTWVAKSVQRLRDFVQSRSDNQAVMVNVGGAALFNLFCLSGDDKPLYSYGAGEPEPGVSAAWTFCDEQSQAGGGRYWHHLTSAGLRRLPSTPNGYFGTVYGVPLFFDANFDTREGPLGPKRGVGVYGVETLAGI